MKIVGNKKEVSASNNLVDFLCSENSLNAKLHYIIATTLMFSNIKKSKSFKVRIKRRYFPQKISEISLRSIARYLKKLLILAFYKSVSYSSIASKIFISILKKFLTINRSFEDFINREKPDLILIPTNGFYSFELDIEYTLHKLGKKYISLVDNWDNLSSKTILIYKANHYGVWGDQNRMHAHEIQNISPDKTTSIGTPRYEIYKIQTLKNFFSLSIFYLQDHLINMMNLRYLKN